MSPSFWILYCILWFVCVQYIKAILCLLLNIYKSNYNIYSHPEQDWGSKRHFRVPYGIHENDNNFKLKSSEILWFFSIYSISHFRCSKSTIPTEPSGSLKYLSKMIPLFPKFLYNLKPLVTEMCVLIIFWTPFFLCHFSDRAITFLRPQQRDILRHRHVEKPTTRKKSTGHPQSPGSARCFQQNAAVNWFTFRVFIVFLFFRQF